ncbi:hypothetical protein BDA96_01G054800 [Sorghum bicolor]|uniref:Uncharacterized protein n=2 Tax=Sorghum bicolor TaxID=4558 RepID=A0A921UWN0_SORBI|nr:hypothetical protein BDA96_01G054800 [Sorghum bicolor]KXG37348.2 hypothetical protein SORBI_3001G053601 [Sorghum bicolor]
MKESPLAREISLRQDVRMLKDHIDKLIPMGMLRWVAFKEEQVNINRLLMSIKRSITIYKHRRLQVGLFYLVPSKYYIETEIRSYLFRMPVKEALKRRRLDMKKRREILANSTYNAHDDTTVTGECVSVVGQSVYWEACTTRLLVYTVASLALGCIIVFS